MAAGGLDQGLSVGGASMPEQRWLPVAGVDPESVPYFSLIVVTGDSRNGSRSRHTSAVAEELTLATSGAAELLVVGLGPGPPPAPAARG